MDRSFISVLRSSRLRSALCLAAGFAMCCVARAQDPAPSTFEVASVKPSGPIDPGRQRLGENMENTFPRGLFSIRGRRLEAPGRTVTQLVAAAYQIPAREIVGPSWMSDARFDIVALIPAAQSPEKVSDRKAFDNIASEMLRTLLAERFALKAHHEDRKVSGYTLSVAKGGPKLTETGPAVPTSDPSKFVRLIKPGFNGTQLDHADMAQLTNQLARSLGAPVDDQTGLKGHYQIVMQYKYEDFADEGARPAILRAILSDYGLRLAAGKIDAPFLVIDNVSRAPREN